MDNPIIQKLYPVELYLGGRVGNIGCKKAFSAIHNMTGWITLFFDNHIVHKKWLKALERTTGSYNIKNYYTHV